jgi:nickel transport protein
MWGFWSWQKTTRADLRVAGAGLLLIFCACLIFAPIPAAATPPGVPTAEGPTPEAKATAVDRQVLEDTVNKALEHQLTPVKEMLTELTIHRTSLTDIIGGIGYILGIFGVWAYCLSKRKKDS